MKFTVIYMENHLPLTMVFEVHSDGSVRYEYFSQESFFGVNSYSLEEYIGSGGDDEK